MEFYILWNKILIMEKRDIVKAVGLNIKKLRKASKLTQEQLAAESGLSTDTISSIERGKISPTVFTLHQIARALKIENYELITCSDAADKKQYINEFYNLIRNRSPQECEDILLALRLLLPPEK